LLEQSLRAEQVAWKTSGVLDVDNELRVAARGVGGDAEIEQRVRMIIKGDERFIDTSLQLEVKAGFVTLRGLFEDPGDVLALKHRIASIPGVLDVKIEAVLVAHRVMPDRTRGSSLAAPDLGPDDLRNGAERHHCGEPQIGASHLGWFDFKGDDESLHAVARHLQAILDRRPRTL
jgi:hypothetical protein